MMFQRLKGDDCDECRRQSTRNSIQKLKKEYRALRDPNLTPWSDKKSSTNGDAAAAEGGEELGSSSSASSTTEAMDGRMINGEFVKTHGMSWFVSGLFLVGDMAGGGIVALPTAVQQCGFWVGIIVCVIMAFVATTSAVLLGRAWLILLRLWPEYRTHCRKPYAEIGYRALGPKAKSFVSNIHDFIVTLWNSGPGVCIVILFVGLILWPVTMLKSPEDFWWAIVAGMCSTAVAVVLILVGAGMDHAACGPHRGEPGFRLINFFTALGTVVFTFGGHSTFPTIQHDMRRPAEFTRSAIMAFASMLTLTLMFNPLNQEAEEFFKVPQEFGIKRVLLRTAMMLAVIFTAESVPSFGPVLNLMGASTVTLTCVIFPPIFYLYLNARERKALQEGEDKSEGCSLHDVIRLNSRPMLAVCAFIVVVGVIGGGAATYSAVVEITGTHFEVPCYVKPFLHHVDNHTATSTNCCGVYQNISVKGYSADTFCNEPKLDFYG
ncbi:Amino acid transporter, transmembrane family-containing protein [Aphelenchoides fujianensis]|nr:Amino acid transporter, transmembrane family-containing protein [Aphelenchoides fujianensis]